VIFYAVGTQAGTVFRLQEAGYHPACTTAPNAMSLLWATTSATFLERLLAAVAAFADNGIITDL
jgi:hypothetical protein